MRLKTLHGVNLGGWLIVEKWMTPSLFNGSDAIDEFTLSQTTAGRKAIKNHHKTFIQESDFQWLKDNGIDIIRVPVGYWLFESEDNLIPHVHYVDWVMNMAEKYNIEVLIDLHGLKGSQNGRDHSGKSGVAEWFKVEAYRTQSIDVLEKIAYRYATHPKFWGLQIINEPFPKLFNLKLRAYYKNAADRLSGILKHTRIVFSDSFTPRLMSGVLPHINGKPAVMDIHVYQPFRPWIKFVPLDFFFDWLNWQKKLHQRLMKKQSVIIGEWSGVIRHEDLMKVPEHKRDSLTKDYITQQLAVYSASDAWFYWSYKTEGPGTWNYRSLVENGMISNK
ncbi:MAG: cellulase family glycosylhydrolase [Candidatus Microsaccharimonas sp.]